MPGTHFKYFVVGDKPNLANRRTGKRMVDDEVAFLTKRAAELRAAYPTADKPADAARLLRFEDVETFWETTARPVLPKFESYAPYHQPTAVVQELPADSVWKANGTGPLRG